VVDERFDPHYRAAADRAAPVDQLLDEPWIRPRRQNHPTGHRPSHAAPFHDERNARAFGPLAKGRGYRVH
jgi:hypothetical protein